MSLRRATWMGPTICGQAEGERVGEVGDSDVRGVCSGPPGWRIWQPPARLAQCTRVAPGLRSPGPPNDPTHQCAPPTPMEAAGRAAFGACWCAARRTSENKHPQQTSHPPRRAVAGRAASGASARAPSRVAAGSPGSTHTFRACRAGTWTAAASAGEAWGMRQRVGGCWVPCHNELAQQQPCLTPPPMHAQGGGAAHMAARPPKVTSDPLPAPTPGTHLHVDHDPGAGGAMLLPRDP